MAPPKKPADQVKSTWLKLRVTEVRLERWKEAAAKARVAEDDEDLDFSAWVRRALNRAEKEEAAQRAKRGGR